MIKFIQSILILWIVCFGLNQIHAQVTIANALPGCLPVASQVGHTCPTNGTKWFYGINGSGKFEVNNIDGINCCPDPPGGGDGEAYFEFATIDISNYSNIQITFDYSAANATYEDDSHGSPIYGCTGSVFPDNSHDQIVFYYSLDGGATFTQSLFVHGTTTADFTGTWMAGPLNGSTLTIRVNASNKAQDEKFYFQNLVIKGTQILTAGPDKTACPGQTVQLDGAGTGTWSGGAGTFSNITSPTSTYTPHSSESNSSVTLTFTGSPVYPGCVTPSDQMVITVGQNENASFTLNDFCAPNSGNANITGTSGGTFAFDPPPGDGATINPATGMITNAVGGHSYTVKYTTPGTCFDTKTITVNAKEGPVGTLSGSGILCPGQCATFSFSFSSGSEPYTLNLSVSPPGFALPPISGVSTSQIFTICYSGSGPLPSYDSGTSTITIPTIYSGSGSLVLTGISDNSGCPGSASGSYSLTLTSAPTANNAGPLTQCASMNGTATFNLTSLDNTIKGGNSSYTVNWFEDAGGTIPISNPSAYTSSGGVVYAQVSNGACVSALVPITLIVETTNIPFVDMVCELSGQNSCVVCLKGNTMDLGFIFGDNKNYVVTVVDNSTSLQYSGTVNNFIALSVPVSMTTTFQLVDVQPINGCPNIATYNNVVTITVVPAPDIDPVNIPPACQSLILPPITGSNLSGNGKYYTGPGGTGIAYDPGITITTSQTLYIFDDNGGCTDEEIVVITIIPLVTFDDIPDLEGCGSVVLPAITGVGVSSDAYYSTNPDGTGTTYTQGSTVTSSVILYIFDPKADPTCLGSPVTFSVVIHSIPPIPDISPIDCSGGNNSGNFQIQSPLGPEYEYKLDNNPYQSSGNYSGVSNGAHTITVKHIVTGCTNTAQVNVNCNCANPATITLPFRNGEICVNDTFNLRGITFGGGANMVVVTSNGTGTFSPTSSNSTPFNFQYIPSPADAGKVISILFTSNDPDGSGTCTPIAVSFSLTVHALPSGMIQGQSVVCEKGSVQLTAVGGSKYLWSNNGGMSSTATFTNIIGSQTYFVTITDDFGCKNVLSHAITTKTSSAGRDSFAVFCNVVPVTINLFNYLTPETVKDGVWKTGKDTIKSPTTFLITGLPLGDTTINYIIFDKVCGVDTAKLHVTINEGNNAGKDFTNQYCQDAGTILDLFSLLGKHDNGGRWTLKSGTLDISDPKSIQISKANPGKYELFYIIDNNNCLPDTALVTLFVITKPNAGDDINTSACIGGQIDLSNLLTGVDKTGMFTNPNKYSGLNGNVWNTSGLKEGNYSFEYVVDGVFPCSNDVAKINIQLKSALNAGKNVQDKFCDAKKIKLFDFIDPTADKGGVFIYQGQLVSNGVFATSDNIDSYVFIYEVGDGVTCPKATSTLTLTKIKKPVISKITMPDICIGSCAEMNIEIQHATNVLQFYIHATDLITNKQYSGNLAVFKDNVSEVAGTFCARTTPPYSMGQFPPNTQIVITLDSIQIKDNFCVFELNQPVTFKTVALNEKTIKRTLCSNETFTVGGKVFSTSNPKGDVTIRSVNQGACDTIAHVELQFYPELKGVYEASFCDVNKTVTIGNDIFSFAKPNGIAVLKGAAAHGCDSLVNVRLNYNKIIIPGDYTYATCDENYKLVLGGQTFDKSHPKGQALIPDVATGGCDSLVNVNLKYEILKFDYSIKNKCDTDPAVLLINTATQNGPYDVFIDGDKVISLAKLPIEIPVASGNKEVKVTTSAGCSSVVNVVVNPNAQSPDVQLTQVPLPNESVQISVIAPQNSIYNLEWMPFSTLSCKSCFDPIATPEVTTTYFLNYLYGNDCHGMRSITIERLNEDVTIPNIFSPNNDGINDKFFVFVSDKLNATIKNMSIYDRWGNLMFQIKDGKPNDPEFGWNGKFGTGLVNPGVYVYSIEVFFGTTGGSKKYAGSLTVVH